jgi:transposase
MSCDHCGSSDTRKAEAGFIVDTYHCLACGHSFERPSSAAITIAVTAIGGPILGALAAILTGGGGGDGDGGGDS